MYCEDDGGLGFNLKSSMKRAIAAKRSRSAWQRVARSVVAPGSALVPVQASGQQTQLVNSGVLPSNSTFFQQQQYPVNSDYAEPLFPEQTSAAVLYPDSLLPNEPTSETKPGDKSNAGNLLKYGTIALLALKLLA